MIKIRMTWYVIILLAMTTALSGCLFSSESDKANAVTKQFWLAVMANDMETAKQYTTWDSAQYLQYLQSSNISPKRFELGELQIDEYKAEKATLLFGGKQGNIEIPARTVLVRYEDDWRVDAQKTMASMATGAMGSVMQELNGLLQQGLQDWDRTISNNINQLGQRIEKGMSQFQGLDETINKNFDQLGKSLEEGMSQFQSLDETIDHNLNQLGKSLEKGMNHLQKELQVLPDGQSTSPAEASPPNQEQLI